MDDPTSNMFKKVKKVDEYVTWILERCFYNRGTDCRVITDKFHVECNKRFKGKYKKCSQMIFKTLVKYCSMEWKEADFCKTLTSTTQTSTTSSTSTTTTTTLNPLLKTQYVVSYGAIGAVAGILLLATIICCICNWRAEKKRKEAEKWHIPGWTSSDGSKKSDVESGESWGMGWGSEADGKNKKNKKDKKTKTGTKTAKSKTTGTSKSATSTKSGTGTAN